MFTTLQLFFKKFHYVLNNSFLLLLKIGLIYRKFQEVAPLSNLLYNFSPIKRRKKKKTSERNYEIICFMFCNNFFHKNNVVESVTPLLLQKEKYGSAKSDASKVLFPDVGKITNCLFPESSSKILFMVSFQIYKFPQILVLEPFSKKCDISF